jgi:hypothetical protein
MDWVSWTAIFRACGLTMNRIAVGVHLEAMRFAHSGRPVRYTLGFDIRHLESGMSYRCL